MKIKIKIKNIIIWNIFHNDQSFFQFNKLIIKWKRFRHICRDLRYMLWVINCKKIALIDKNKIKNTNHI